MLEIYLIDFKAYILVVIIKQKLCSKSRLKLLSREVRVVLNKKK